MSSSLASIPVTPAPMHLAGHLQCGHQPGWVAWPQLQEPWIRSSVVRVVGLWDEQMKVTQEPLSLYPHGDPQHSMPSQGQATALELGTPWQ